MGPKYSVRLHNLIDSLNWFEGLAVKENCDEVLYLGDTFDRPDLNAMEITSLQEVKFSDIPHRFLIGNHEANIASLDFSSVKIFESSNAEIISNTKKIEVNDKVDLYFIPYQTCNKSLSLADYVDKNNKKKIILSHNDIAGIRYGRFMSENGFDVVDILDNCTLFLNGHLHNGYVINDRIFLIGNLTGCNFNEDANKYEHYAYILTIDDGGQITLEPRVNPFAFNFYKVYINSNEELKKLDNLKNNAVVSIICDGKLLKEVNEKVTEISNLAEYKIIANYANDEDSSSLEFTVEDHLKQFITYVQTKIEPSQILTEELAILGGDYN